MSSSVQYARVGSQSRSRGSSSWAVAGIIAGIGSFASVFLSMMLSPDYIPGSVMTPERMDAEYVGNQPVMVAFHIATVVSALLVVVFAAGLHRRLRQGPVQDALAPMVAFAGLLLLAAAQVLGSGLDTEFLFGVGDSAINLPSDIGLYSHWVATIPWLWVGGGLAALAVGAARRSAAVPRWIQVTSFVLGGLTVLIGISPLQYMSALPGTIWMVVVATGFVLGDRIHRRRLSELVA